MFSACAGGNIKIKIKPDLSGDLVLYQKKITKRPSGIFFGTGLTPSGELEITVKERAYQFKNYTHILPPGFRFIQFTEDQILEIQLVVDTGKSSPLLSALEINKEEIDSILNEAKLRDDLLRFNTLVEFIQFEIQFPFSIKKVKFADPRTPGEWTARLDSNEKLIVNIPLHSVWSNEHPLTTIQIYPESN
ncbi:hypothetical protein EHQ68_09745 [Leptospira congkakensis]|uniref:Uncharacterized protein n=1 Tax=Leptospira congkakensis TaxID=2484932 RepID=A0A4Z1A8G8_9LEPT|nr:hypothetical protein EHQ69_18340 [Leptospira congkakensis]TGL88936.1 hypothetical protein EHQ68_09745 [Leptospira congkakensis]TGL93443.1 hypothetical protein EHQ70_17910 [Leptospira congkakensis]